jgi:phosphoribosylamine--glycine ligase
VRVLGIGECNDLAAMYGGMQARGHEVRVFVSDASSHGVYEGIVSRTADWQQELGWVKAVGDDGLILFETADQGATQDALRAEGFQVIGGCALGDRLESDRAYGQSVLWNAGLRTARTHAFHSYPDAVIFLSQHRQRYVLKFNGANGERTRNYIAQASDSSDLSALLEFYDTQGTHGPAPDFVLMEYIEGVEVGIGGYFNGSEFLTTACIDFEHKRFFPGELGELTGEMGTVVSYEGSARLRTRVLEPLTGLLREGGYCGYLNVNLMANADGLWPLEFTSRFGYPGYAICETLHCETWESIFRKMLGGADRAFAVAPGFAVGVVLTVPPFPHRQGYAEMSKGLPVLLDERLSAAQRRRLSFAEVKKVGKNLVTTGCSGYVGVATGCALTVDEARLQALDIARKVYVPNLRYRTDIGARVSDARLAELRQWGVL